MPDFDHERLIYLLILGGLLGAVMLRRYRGQLLKGLQHMAAWALIFLGTIAAIGLWDDIRQTLVPYQAIIRDTGQIVVPRSADGHYHVWLDVNGIPTEFLVDTGATDIVLTRQDAERVGLDPDNLQFIGRANTANGTVSTATIRLDTLTLGPVTDRNVTAVVNGGAMQQSLLGMGYLQRWGRIEIARGELILTR